MPSSNTFLRFWILTLWALIATMSAWAQRTPLKPGMNLFSPAQDVEMGRQVSADAEKQLQLLNDRKVDDYLSRLGKRLAANAHFEKYPYQFKTVNAMSINAFALPGGFLYVNRGTIEAADTEAQLAGVIAHEIGHAALRHGTNQASKAYLAQMPLAILGGLGGRSTAAILGQLGGTALASTVLLKYSRDAERQADLMGAQILYDTHYDPRAMLQFFEKLQAQGGAKMPQWLSSHPDTENRISDISVEIDRLGGPPKDALTNSREFPILCNYIKTLPKPKETSGVTPPATSQTGGQRPPKPSTRVRAFNNDLLQLGYPDNWSQRGNDASVTLVPENGTVSGSQGEALAYGIIVSVFTPQAGKTGRFDLKEATDQLIADLQKSNPNMRASQASAQMRVDGERALSTRFRNDSALGGLETNWIVTVLRPEGLCYFIAVAPEKEYADYQRAFENIVSSVQFIR